MMAPRIRPEGAHASRAAEKAATVPQTDGGPAFPMQGSTDPNGNHTYPEYGMSLRDWFAGQALAALPLRDWGHIPTDEAKIAAWASCAYAVADAMLAERAKGESHG